MSHSWFARSTAALAGLLVGIDGTVPALAAPYINRDLDTTGTEILWVVDIYSLVLAGLLISMTALADRIGQRRLLLYGSIAFAGLSALNAYAFSTELLIAGRALQGVAAALLVPAILTLVQGPARQAVGIWVAVFLAGTALGPVLGGVLLERFWWGSVFLINIPVMAALLIAGYPQLPEGRDADPRPQELLTAALPVAGIIAVAYAVKHTVLGGVDLTVVAAAAAGAVALVCFARDRLRAHRWAVEVLADHRFRGLLTVNLLVVLTITALAFFLPQYLMLVKGYRPGVAGAVGLPAVAAAALFAALAGLSLRWFNPRPVLTAGLAAAGSATASVMLIRPDTLDLHVVMAVFGLGAGLGLAFTVANILMLRAVPAARTGAAVAVADTGYRFGVAAGIGVLGCVLTAGYRAALTVPEDIPPAAADRARESMGAAAEMAARLPALQSDTLLTAAREAFTAGLAVMAAGAAALLLAAALAACLRMRTPLPGEPEVGVLADPGVHGDAGGDRGVDAAGRTELCDRNG
ncbi:MAG: MFS transporter [Mycolicibacterium hassiacum]|jgi:DHA2 family multidrug resistance protein-like MFS transporter